MSKIDYHTDAVEELDVEGILAFAERILPRAADLWGQASLDYRQRLQELFFPKGIAYDGKRFNRTAVTAPYLEPDERAESSLASPTGSDTNGDGRRHRASGLISGGSRLARFLSAGLGRRRNLRRRLGDVPPT